jgi:hypothetical protein
LHARNNLKKQNIIETKIKKACGNPTVHYRICEHNLLKSLVSYQRVKTKLPKGIKRNHPLVQNETAQKYETSNRLNYSPNTHTTTTVCGDEKKCFPRVSGSAAKGLAKEVMSFLETTGSNIRNRQGYLLILQRAAERGELEIPKGYISPDERAEREVRRQKVEAEAARDEDAERARIEAAAEKFDKLPPEEKEKWLAEAETEAGMLISFPGLLRKRAEMLAWRAEGCGCGNNVPD